MKFLVALFAVILGVSFIGQSDAWGISSLSISPDGSWRETTEYGINHRAYSEIKSLKTICTYLTKNSELHCTGPSDPIKCPAILIEDMLPEQSMKFGLGQLDSSLVFSEGVKIRMFPKKLDSSGWLCHNWLADGKEFDFSMYYGEKDMGQGIRVTDKVCYEKLFDMVKSSVPIEEVVFSGYLDDQRINPLVGYIVIH